MGQAAPVLTAETPALKPPPTLWEVLEKKYCLPHYLLLREVRNDTGFNATRSADGILISFYVSRGQSITGIEIKESRSDWLRELNRPEKAEAIAKYCDYFYLATSTEAIAKIEEIPQPWGWMTLRGAKLKVMKRAEKIASAPLDRGLFCSLVQSAIASIVANRQKDIDEAVEARIQERQSYAEIQRDDYRRQRDDLIEMRDEFEKASGLSIRKYNDLTDIGRAVRAVLQGEKDFTEHLRQLNYLKTSADHIAQKITREMEQLKTQIPALVSKAEGDN